jgi:phosphohistidine phosphatase
MKTILIMRHGEAMPMQADDAARQLTQEGHAEVDKMGLWLAKSYAPDAVLVSPYIRAQQTAQAVAKYNEFKYSETTTDITPEGKPQVAADYIETLMAAHSDCNTWLVVAHMPIVSYLVDQLCPGKLPIFNTAAVAVIQYNEQTQRSEYISIKSPGNI